MFWKSGQAVYIAEILLFSLLDYPETAATLQQQRVSSFLVTIRQLRQHQSKQFPERPRTGCRRGPISRYIRDSCPFG
jgi:hypothetical protein